MKCLTVYINPVIFAIPFSVYLGHYVVDKLSFTTMQETCSLYFLFTDI